MRYRTAIAVSVLWLARTLDAQPTSAPASLPTHQPIPRQTLVEMYRRELGTHFNAADSEKYVRAGELLEQYFGNSETRRATLASLQALGLDPNIIGRLTRIRLDWPQLDAGVYYINERVGPHAVRYYLGVPKGYDRTAARPLVIKLPTPDAFIAEPKPDPIRVTQIYSGWMTDELTQHPDALVIMPLLSLDELWGPSYAGMNSVIQPMLHAAGRVNIDPTRVYMIGHSMSGHAAWNLALHYPTYLAAFNVLAGGAGADWQRIRMLNLRNTLPIVWHDADDSVVKVDSARQLVRLLGILKINVDYQETKSVGHVPSAAIAEQCYRKMRARKRELYPAEVSLQSSRPDTMFNRNDWVQIYQPANTSNDRRYYFTRGSGHMVVYPSPFKIEARLEQNKITVTSQNVQSMRFYVNDQMVDFSRAVSVIVNRRPRFEAILKPNLEEMLKDQLFLGRGWRYYTAVVDIDFGPERPATTRAATTSP